MNKAISNIVRKYGATGMLLFCFSLGTSVSQNSSLPLNNSGAYIVERTEVITGVSSSIDVTVKPFQRSTITKYALSLGDSLKLSEKEKWDLEYIYKDNNEWLVEPELPLSISEKKRGDKYKFNTDKTHPKYFKNNRALLKYFYKTPANFYEEGNEHFYIKVNPLLHFEINKDFENGRSLFTNMRGIEIRGGIDNRVFFYTNLLEQQQRFPNYVTDFIDANSAIPQNGLYKKYKSSVFNSADSYDYLNSQGYVGFNVTPNIAIQFGHSRNLIGSGYRSMLLSNFSQNYLNLKLNWKVSKFHYQNIFAELNSVSPRTFTGNEIVPKKYFAAHYLNYQPSSNFSIGIFESVVLNRDNEYGRFELQYLNPIILYRSVESMIGSPDNVLLGINSKLNLFNRVQLYGQLMVDEFKFKELVTDNQNWWGNKFGAQLGLKYFNVAEIDHLDIQLEMNVARPYTYTHRDTFGASYTHNNMALAHPLGANFREFVSIVRYKPFKRFDLSLRYIHINSGEDVDDMNWGSNITIPNVTRVRDYDNVIGQGIDTKINILGIIANFELMHNTYLFAEFLMRKKESALTGRSGTEQYIGGGIRMNIQQFQNDF